MKYCDKCGEGSEYHVKKCPKCNCEIFTPGYKDDEVELMILLLKAQ